MKKSLFVISFLMTTALVSGQNATISETTLNMKTYPFSDPNPVAEINRLYPNFRFDGYTNKSIRKDWKMVVMENKYIKVWVCPEIGGKIWGAIEKSTGKEFLYYNHVVKFRDIAMRGPWTSGGLEYNFGDIGHIPSCATPVDYAIKQNEDGSVSCILGTMDFPSHTKWNVEVRLPKDKAYFETKASWFNTTSLPCSYYHWMNAANKVSGNLEFLYPGTKFISHGGEASSWPVNNGRDIKFYNKNNFGSYKSYHVINGYTNFIGGYYHDEDFGFGHLANYDDKPGHKIWIWGLSQQGMLWKDLLTDTDDQYCEWQPGKLFNQAASNSSLTPFKHREFAPHDADVMIEKWFPLVKTKGMVAASEYAVLNVIRHENKADVYVSALQSFSEDLKITVNGVETKNTISLNPLEIYNKTVNLDEKEEIDVELGAKKLFYSSKKEDVNLERPTSANPDFDWSSAFGIYTKALECEKQRMFTEALGLYLKSLEKEPAFAPALNRTALAYYRQMEYEKALQYVQKSLAIDTYDPEANYAYGLICTALHKNAEAKAAFGVCVQSPQYRSAAYTELARLFLLEKRLDEAQNYCNKALSFNLYNNVVLEMLAVAYRMQNNREEALRCLEKLESYDATNHFVNFEKLAWKLQTREDCRAKITNELPNETYVDLAIRYVNYGCIAEAIEVLSCNKENPLALLWLAYLDKTNMKAYLQAALKISPEMVFPSRNEMIPLLAEFSGFTSHWKLDYYSGLLYWNMGLKDKAKEYFLKCGDTPDFAPFYLAKAKLFKTTPDVYIKAIEKARQIAPDDWHVQLEWVDNFMAKNQFREAAQLSKRYYDKYPEKTIFGIRYAKALIEQKEYSTCLAFLDKFNVIPYEGSTEGRAIFREASLKAAFNYMSKKNYPAAIRLAIKSKEWPINLGVGKPYDVDERLDDYLIATAYEKMGKTKNANDYLQKVASYVHMDESEEGSKLYLQAIALKKLNRSDEATEMINSMIKKYPKNEYLKWVRAKYANLSDTQALKEKILNTKDISDSYNILFFDKEFSLLLECLDCCGELSTK